MTRGLRLFDLCVVPTSGRHGARKPKAQVIQLTTMQSAIEEPMYRTETMLMLM